MPSLQSRLYLTMLKRMNVSAVFSGPVEESRRKIESSTAMIPTPKGVKVKQARDCPVPAEWLEPVDAPEDRVLLYFHGGGFVLCSINTHRGLVARLAEAGGCRALNVDYRLAPEHPFPAGLEDCLAAYRWLLAQGIPPSGIVFGGDSAGGNLTLAALLALKDAGEPLPVGAVCLSPATDLTASGESYVTKRHLDPVLGGLEELDLVETYGGGRDPKNPLISPLFGDLRGRPPVLIHVGENEILLDDSTRFVERARAAGVDAEVVVWPGMWHVFQIFGGRMPETKKSIRMLGEFIRQRQGGN